MRRILLAEGVSRWFRVSGFGFEVSRFALVEVSLATSRAGACFHGSRASDSGLVAGIRGRRSSFACGCAHGALGGFADVPPCPRRPGSPKKQAPTLLAATGMATGRENRPIFGTGLGIDGPSRPINARGQRTGRRAGLTRTTGLPAVAPFRDERGATPSAVASGRDATRLGAARTRRAHGAARHNGMRRHALAVRRPRPERRNSS
jgi:hypothetical protein